MLIRYSALHDEAILAHGQSVSGLVEQRVKNHALGPCVIWDWLRPELSFAVNPNSSLQANCKICHSPGDQLSVPRWLVIAAEDAKCDAM